MRAQAAIEYLLVSSVALLIIVPSIFFVLMYSQNQSRDFESSQILRIGDRMALTTQTVYNGGKGTRSTVTETFPEGIVNITFVWDSGLQVGEYLVYYDPEFTGDPQIYGFVVGVPVALDTDDTFWGAGQRRIRFDVLENLSAMNPYERLYVNVTVI